VQTATNLLVTKVVLEIIRYYWDPRIDLLDSFRAFGNYLMPVSTNYLIRLARRADATQIAILSRDLIEAGLGWSWTPTRVAHSIDSKNSNVILAFDKNNPQPAGFAIMEFHQQHAHLNLLAVAPEYRGVGIGRNLVVWLEQVALVAGIGVVYLETPAINRQARNFYRHLAYKEIQSVPGYYQGRRNAVRMARDLWLREMRGHSV
jgi:ribosomal protein S18 acetylase RimI-like enzyme